MCKDGIFIPIGNSYEELKERKQVIKDLYSQWVLANPDKKVWNKSLRSYINVKYLSITETVDKGSLHFESTAAISNLTQILENAVLIAKIPTKWNSKNQRSFVKMFELRYQNLKVMVGLNKRGEFIQYSITLLQK